MSDGGGASNRRPTACGPWDWKGMQGSLVSVQGRGAGVCILPRLQAAGMVFGDICLWFEALGLEGRSRHPRLGGYPPNCLRSCLDRRLVLRREGNLVYRLQSRLGRHPPESLVRYLTGYSVRSGVGYGPRCLNRSRSCHSGHRLHGCPARHPGSKLHHHSSGSARGSLTRYVEHLRSESANWRGESTTTHGMEEAGDHNSAAHSSARRPYRG
jgi:hypothetical protein